MGPKVKKHGPSSWLIIANDLLRVTFYGGNVVRRVTIELLGTKVNNMASQVKGLVCLWHHEHGRTYRSHDFGGGGRSRVLVSWRSTRDATSRRRVPWLATPCYLLSFSIEFGLWSVAIYDARPAQTAEDSEEWCVLRTAHDDESFIRPFAFYRERSEAFDDQYTVFFWQKNCRAAQ